MSRSEKVRRAIEAILERSATDVAFRQQLLVDPRVAIERSFGVTIPAYFSIQFVEKDKGVDALVVLPELREYALEDEGDGLDAVRGGVADYAWSDEIWRSE